MKVLVACEESATVREAFRRRGHDAYSCDLLDSRIPGQHFKGDVLEVLARYPRWDLMIAHPPCTYLTCSAEWAYKDGPYHMKLKPGTLVGAARRRERERAIDFVRFLDNQGGIPMIAIENPVGVLSSIWREPSQIIQPYDFGEDASKATCLWLKGLPLLVPTKRHPPRMVNYKGKLVARWGNQTDGGQNNLSPGEDRAMERSKTYPGIAEAMAEQWGRLAA